MFINNFDPIAFQVFSLENGTICDDIKSPVLSKKKKTVRVTEQGVYFKKYTDGKELLLTPESSIQAQQKLGADIIIPLDELPSSKLSGTALKESLDRTHRWEERSLREHQKNPNQQAIYGVVHGGVDLKLRQESIDYLGQSFP